MGTRVIEGTWEEVALRAGELSGRRVRVTVLDERELESTLDRALAPLVAEAEALTGQLPPAPGLIPTDAWSEGVVGKFRRQGFDL
jgi:hypothetical protein